jgi:hypothetical protein
VDIKAHQELRHASPRRRGQDARDKAGHDELNGEARFCCTTFESDSHSDPVVTGAGVVHVTAHASLRLCREAAIARECKMDELNGRMIACQILITGLIARVANNSPDPLRFLTDFRDEIKAVVKGVNIAGMDNTDRVRLVAQQTVDELFSLMKPPSTD